MVRSERTTLADCNVDRANARIAEMRQQALEVVLPASSGRELTESVLVELRYSGQGHELRIPVDTPVDRDELERIRERFEGEYERIYGLRISRSEIDLVTWMLSISTPPGAATARNAAAELEESRGPKEAGSPKGLPTLTEYLGSTQVEPALVWEPGLGEAVNFGRYWRFDLDQHSIIAGPALIAEDETTTVIPSGWRASVDASGHLLLELESDSAS